MLKDHCRRNLNILIFGLAILLSGASALHAQVEAAGGGYYVAGYGSVYGSFGQASAAQSRLYDKMKQQKAGRSSAQNPQAAPKAGPKVTLPAAAKNVGVFRPDASVDSAKLLADALGETAEEKALIKEIFSATKKAYEKEAAARGWKNNIAASLTFFTATAITVYHDTEEPSEEAIADYFKLVSAAIDDTPEFAKVANKEKQGFSDMLIGFSGLLLAGYTEGKQTENAETIADSKKLAGVLIELVLKADPNKLRVANDRIVIE